jgi:hypothetical protein
MLDDLEFKVDFDKTSWHFSPRARLKLWQLGATHQTELREFVTRLLAMDILRPGTTELNLSGIGLRITNQNITYHVETIEE